MIFKELERNRFDALMGVDDVGKVLADRLAAKFKVKKLQNNFALLKEDSEIRTVVLIAEKEISYERLLMVE